jgi:oxygen-independent coproporphyrinogen-3 oxidase
MWDLNYLESLGLDFTPAHNAFTYTFPPHHIAEKKGAKCGQSNYFRSNDWPDIGLYLHIPFCEMNCRFCSLHRQVAKGTEELVERYLRTLHKEIAAASNYFIDVPVSSIYIGGGTPSILTVEQLSGLLDEILNSYAIKGSPSVCIEFAPDLSRTSDDWMAYITSLVSRKKLPVTRISVGVQSFHNRTLIKLGRRGGYQSIRELLNVIDTVLPSYNIDLLFGFPKKSSDLTEKAATDSLINHVSFLLDQGFRLPSITLYQLWDADTILGSRANNFYLPNKETLFQEKWKLQNDFFRLGYHPSLFSRLIKNKEYEDSWSVNKHLDFRQIGFGSGAYSILPNKLVFRPRNIAEYINTVDGDPVNHNFGVCYTLNSNEVFIRKLIMGLRSYKWISVHNCSSSVDDPSGKEVLERIHKLIQAGLIDRHGDQIRINSEAFMITNEISTYIHPSSYPRRDS